MIVMGDEEMEVAILKEVKAGKRFKNEKAVEVLGRGKVYLSGELVRDQ